MAHRTVFTTALVATVVVDFSDDARWTRTFAAAVRHNAPSDEIEFLSDQLYYEF